MCLSRPCSPGALFPLISFNSWNARSLACVDKVLFKKKVEFCKFLLHTSPILGLQEVKAEQEDMLRAAFPGYTVRLSPGSSASAGVAFIVKDGIDVKFDVIQEGYVLAAFVDGSWLVNFYGKQDQMSRLGQIRLVEDFLDQQIAAGQAFHTFLFGDFNFVEFDSDWSRRSLQLATKA